jgi:YtoQ family protein
MNAERTWNVYLAGEIHSDWRERIATGVAEAGIPVVLTGPVTDHAASDDCGVAILGAEDEKVWHDHKGAGVNAVRTRTLLADADVVVVRFEDAASSIGGTGDISIKRFSGGRARIDVALSEPVDLLRELEESCELDFRVRSQNGDEIVLDVDDRPAPEAA